MINVENPENSNNLLITYTKLSLNNNKRHLLLHFMLFSIQFCVSLCIGCTGKRSGISVKGLWKFSSSEGLSSLRVLET